MNEDKSALRARPLGVALRVGVMVTDELDLGSMTAYRRHLDFRRGPRHDDERANPEPGSRQGDALRVVAGARGDHTAAALGVGEAGDSVVGAPDLEAEDRLQILTFEEHAVCQPVRQHRCHVERRLARDVVDAARQDLADDGFKAHGRGDPDVPGK